LHGYANQPVLLWEDFRPPELLAFFCRKNSKNLSVARGELFKFLDPHQKSHMVDVKFDNIRLHNCINIFDCIKEPEEWLDGLAGEYVLSDGTTITGEEKQKSQVYRRFPITFWIMENDYSFRINKGVLYDTREYTQWVGNERFRGSLAELVHRLNPEQYLKMSDKMIAPAITAINDLKTHLEEPKPEYTDDELDAMFGNYGTVIDEVQEQREQEVQREYYARTYDETLYIKFMIDTRQKFMDAIEREQAKLDKLNLQKHPDEFDIHICNRNIEQNRQRLKNLDTFTYDDYCKEPVLAFKRIYEI